MRIAMLGAGALGCALGGRLSQAGHEVQLLARNPAHLQAINQHGLQLTVDENSHSVPVSACRPEHAKGPVDLIVLLTKTFQSDLALADAKPLVSSPGVAILSLQNGLGNAQCLRQYVSDSQIMIGMSMTPADLNSPGNVSTRSTGKTMFMFADAVERPFGHEVERAFLQAGVDASYGRDISSAIWEKVAFNTATNAILGITQATPGILRDSTDAMQLAKDIAAETIRVARAKGVDANESGVLDLIELSADKHPNHKPSMLQDLLAGRPTEVDSLNGAVVSAALALDLQAPLNEAMYRLVKLCECRNARQ